MAGIHGKSWALSAALVVTGCLFKAPDTPPDGRDRSGYVSGAETYYEALDSNQIKVTRREYPGVRIGLCTDLAGGILLKSCGAEPREVADHSQDVPFDQLRSISEQVSNQRICLLEDERFTQSGRLVSIEYSGGLTAPGANVEIAGRSGNYALVYEWQRSKNHRVLEKKLPMPPGPDEPREPPQVQSADYGLALRLVMDVALRENDASLSATIGLANLAAALAQQQATVNVKFLALGIPDSFLTTRAIRIDSVADLYEVLDEFHKKVLDVASAWAKKCEQRAPLPSRYDPIYEQYARGYDEPAPPSRSAAPSTGTGGSAPSEPDKKAKDILLTPVMLAYYVQGGSIGRQFEAYQAIRRKCLKQQSEKKEQDKECSLSWASFAIDRPNQRFH
jgi:hypothetical protein